MKSMTKIQLSLMMFLEFFIWGGWFVTLSDYLAKHLSFEGGEIGTVFSSQSWGAIIAPFIIGLIADRFFNAERILGILHLIGAFLMYQLSMAESFEVFTPYVYGYMIVYMPTLALVNSVAFNQMKDPAKEFSFIRVLGTIGWIVAGLTISYFSWDQAGNEALLKNTFLMTAGASAVLGLFSFTLPKTPPKAVKGDKISIGDIIGIKALKLLKDRNFLVFFLASILICIPLAFYYQVTAQFLKEVGVEGYSAKMAIGQGSEVVFMLLLPFFFKRFGFKNTILVGMLAWAVRYLLFAYGDSGELAFMLITGIALHGICYDFFFVSGQIYTDSKAGEEYKSAAQGLITLATYGVGMLVGFWVAGEITDHYLVSENVHDWKSIWTAPAIFAAAVMLLFALVFKNEKIEYKS
jgi:nucleoside transporter